MLSNSLSSVFQTGLAGCWRLQRSISIEHRDLLALKSKMDKRRKPSQVIIVFKSFELIIVIIAIDTIIILFVSPCYQDHNYISDNCWYHHYNQNHYAKHFTNALWIMYLSKLLCFSSVLLIFSRGLSGLRAAHLNQQVVVVGGCTMGVISVGSNNRDEVLCRIISTVRCSKQTGSRR